MKKNKNLTSALYVIIFLITVIGCDNDQVIFRTGFEANTRKKLQETPPRIHKLHGKDFSVPPPNDWDKDLQIVNEDGTEEHLWFNYVDRLNGKSPELLGSRIVNDPENMDNHVLLAWQAGAEWQERGYWSRVQAELNNFKWKEMYFKLRFRIDSGAAQVNYTDERIWCMMPFEISKHSSSVRLSKSRNDSVLHWRLYIKNDGDHFWIDPAPGKYIEPEYNTWQTLEYYTKAGDENTGKVWWAMDGEVWVDTTVNTAKEGYFTDLYILKAYGNLADYFTNRQDTLKVWFDDLEIRKSFPGNNLKTD